MGSNWKIKSCYTAFLQKPTYGRLFSSISQGRRRKEPDAADPSEGGNTRFFCRKVTRRKWFSRVSMREGQEVEEEGSRRRRRKKFSDLLRWRNHGWVLEKAIPMVLCVNTESMPVIKAIPTRYLTAFKVAQSSASSSARRLSPSLGLVFHFPPFHIDFRGTMKFQRGRCAARCDENENECWDRASSRRMEKGNNEKENRDFFFLWKNWYVPLSAALSFEGKLV